MPSMHEPYIFFQYITNRWDNIKLNSPYECEQNVMRNEM